MDKKCYGGIKLLSLFLHLFYCCQPTWISSLFLFACLYKVFLLASLNIFNSEHRRCLKSYHQHFFGVEQRLFRRLKCKKRLTAAKKKTNKQKDSRENTCWIQLLIFCYAKIASLRKPLWTPTSCKGTHTMGTTISRKYSKLLKYIPLGMR